MSSRRLGPLMVVFLVAFATTACEQLIARERVEALKKDLEVIAAQIKATEAEDARYSGGLIKALVGARLAILRHTHAMLDQRAKSWMWGVGLRYTVDGKGFLPSPGDTAQAKALDQELAVLRGRLAAQEVEASRYAGGLVQAMTLASV